MGIQINRVPGGPYVEGEVPPGIGMQGYGFPMDPPQLLNGGNYIEGQIPPGVGMQTQGFPVSQVPAPQGTALAFEGPIPQAPAPQAPAPQAPSAASKAFDVRAFLESDQYQESLRRLSQRESSNQLDVINPSGHVGKWQMSVAALEDAGFIKSGTTAQATARFGASKRNQILNDPSVWTTQGGLQSFLKNEEMQDKAKAIFDLKNYEVLRRLGVIDSSTPSDIVSGYLNAAHLGGVGGAQALAQKGEDRADANGTKVSDYFTMGRGAVGPEQQPTETASPQDIAAPTPVMGGEPWQGAQTDWLHQQMAETMQYGDQTNQDLARMREVAERQAANAPSNLERQTAGFLRVGTGQGRYGHEQALSEQLALEQQMNQAELAPYKTMADASARIDQNSQARMELERAILQNIDQVIASGPLEYQMLNKMFGSEWAKVAAEMSMQGIELDATNIDAFGRAAMAIAADLGIPSTDADGRGTRYFKPLSMRDAEGRIYTQKQNSAGETIWIGPDGNPVPNNDISNLKLYPIGLQSGELAEEVSFGRTEGARASEDWEKIMQSAEAFTRQKPILDRLERVIDNIVTGGAFGEWANFIVQSAGAWGVEVPFLGSASDFATFRQASKDLLVQARQDLQGQGAITDYESRVLEQGLSSLGYAPEGNRAVIEILKRANERALRRARMAQQFIREKVAQGWTQGNALDEFRLNVWPQILEEENLQQERDKPYDARIGPPVTEIRDSWTEEEKIKAIKQLAPGSIVFINGQFQQVGG